MAVSFVWCRQVSRILGQADSVPLPTQRKKGVQEESSPNIGIGASSMTH